MTDQLNEVTRLSRIAESVGPIALVVLSALGLSKLWPIPPNRMNSFDQMAEAALLIGGFGGLFLYIWNSTLRRPSSDRRKVVTLSIAAAVFGLGYCTLFSVFLVIEIASASRPHSKYVGILLVATIGQFLTIMSWLIPKVLIAIGFVKGRIVEVRVGEDSD